jgi:hypothetical protein
MLYSGHDYTLLCVLSALGLTHNYETLLGYGSTLSFELWEGLPPSPNFVSGLERSSELSLHSSIQSTSNQRILRIIQNCAPFRKVEVESIGGKAVKSSRSCTDISFDGSKVLLQITEEEAYDKIQKIRARFIAEEPHGVPL